MRVSSFLFTVSLVAMQSSIVMAQAVYAPAQVPQQVVPQMAYSGNYQYPYQGVPAQAVQQQPMYAAPQPAAPVQAYPTEEDKKINIMQMNSF